MKKKKKKKNLVESAHFECIVAVCVKIGFRGGSRIFQGERQPQREEGRQPIILGKIS